jgi:biopolymer transport protein ExbD
VKKSAFQTESRTTVVPIINVSLVVVLTLMMIAPFLNNEVDDVDLPQARASEVDDTDNIEITFNMNREIFVGNDQVALADISNYVGLMLDGAPHTVAVVKADQNLPYGEVEELIAAVEASQVPRVALATKEKDEEEQP